MEVKYINSTYKHNLKSLKDGYLFVMTFVFAIVFMIFQGTLIAFGVYMFLMNNDR